MVCRKSITQVHKMFCGLLNFYCVIEEVLSELVAPAAGALLQDISIFHFCLLVVVVKKCCFSLPSILSFPTSTPLCRKFQLLPNSQSRFGQFSCLPFSLAPPICSATSWSPWPVRGEQVLSSHRDSLPLLWVAEFPQDWQSGKISPLEDRRPIGRLRDWDKVLFTESFNSPLPPLHLLSEWCNVTPSVRLYLPRWTALLKVNVAHEVL